MGTARLPKNGEYYVMKSLLGGDPDCNRRCIYRWPGDRIWATINPGMEPWTEKHEEVLAVALARFRSGELPKFAEAKNTKVLWTDHRKIYGRDRNGS